MKTVFVVTWADSSAEPDIGVYASRQLAESAALEKIRQALSGIEFDAEEQADLNEALKTFSDAQDYLHWNSDERCEIIEAELNT